MLKFFLYLFLSIQNVSGLKSIIISCVMLQDTFLPNLKLVNRYGINDHGYVPLVVNTFRYFPHS
jgi:hypothetical protein